MGSRGTNRFTDYPGTPSGSSKSDEVGGGGKGEEGGDKKKSNQCLNMIKNVALEEVARSNYFTTHKSLPPEGISVGLRSSLVGGRIGVEIVSTSELVGLLPTEYNYLFQCMKQSYKYLGIVGSTRSKPIPVVRVDLEPKE